MYRSSNNSCLSQQKQQGTSTSASYSCRNSQSGVARCTTGNGNTKQTVPETHKLSAAIYDSVTPSRFADQATLGDDDAEYFVYQRQQQQQTPFPVASTGSTNSEYSPEIVDNCAMLQTTELTNSDAYKRANTNQWSVLNYVENNGNGCRPEGEMETANMTSRWIIADSADRSSCSPHRCKSLTTRGHSAERPYRQSQTSEVESGSRNTPEVLEADYVDMRVTNSPSRRLVGRTRFEQLQQVCGTTNGNENVYEPETEIRVTSSSRATANHLSRHIRRCNEQQQHQQQQQQQQQQRHYHDADVAPLSKSCDQLIEDSGCCDNWTTPLSASNPDVEVVGQTRQRSHQSNCTPCATDNRRPASQSGVILSAEALHVMLQRLTASNTNSVYSPSYARDLLYHQPIPPGERLSHRLPQRNHTTADAVTPIRQHHGHQTAHVDNIAPRHTMTSSSHTSQHVPADKLLTQKSSTPVSSQSRDSRDASRDRRRRRPLANAAESTVDKNVAAAAMSDRLRVQSVSHNNNNNTSASSNNKSINSPTRLHLSEVELPDPPTHVSLSVSGRSSLHVTFNQPISGRVTGLGDDVITRYCVEWSYFENFSRIVGRHVIADVATTSCEIKNLEPGNSYFVRVRAGNTVGFGEPAASSPPRATPSNWRDFEDVNPRQDDKQQTLEELAEYLTRLTTTTDNNTSSQQQQQQQLKNIDSSSSKVRRTFKSLFTSAVRLQKTFKKGLYVAAVVHHEGRVLVTSDDVLPVVEVDADVMMMSLNADLLWLMKVAGCSWHQLKTFQDQLANSSVSSSLQFRSQLLASLVQLQSVLRMRDLGQFHHQPVVDSATGAVILVVIKSLRDVTAFDSTHVHWTSLKKIQKRLSGSTTTTSRPVADPASAMRLLTGGAHDMIVQQHVGAQALGRGLYVTYLQLTSSRDAISVLVPKHQPNFLPYVKVRENPNVTSEEWRWLVNEKLQANSLWLKPVVRSPTDTQLALQEQLNTACDRLLSELGLSKSEANSCRLYDVEVLELNSEVSVLLVLPPVERVCISPFDEPQLPAALQDTHTYLPVQVFEMMHQFAYQPDIAKLFYSLSASVDVRLLVAQHELRQAFTTSDVETSRRLLDGLSDIQQRLDDAWRSVRWLIDVTAYARDRSSSSTGSGLPLGALFRSKPSAVRRGVDDSVEKTQRSPRKNLEEQSTPAAASAVSSTTRSHRRRPDDELTSTDCQGPETKSSASSTPSRRSNPGVHVHFGLVTSTPAARHPRVAVPSAARHSAVVGGEMEPSIVGSDSDYHSDISIHSCALLDNSTSQQQQQQQLSSSRLYYEPVLL